MNAFITIVIILLFLVGLAGTVVPFLPGIPLIFIAIATYGWYEGFNLITPHYLVIMACLTALAIISDYLSTTLGAKYFGSSKQGSWGALIGTFVGIIFFPPLGIFVGPLVGSIIGESLAGNDLNKAIKVGIGTVIGLFSGMIFIIILALGMIISFLIKVL